MLLLLACHSPFFPPGCESDADPLWLDEELDGVAVADVLAQLQDVPTEVVWERTMDGLIWPASSALTMIVEPPTEAWRYHLWGEPEQGCAVGEWIAVAPTVELQFEDSVATGVQFILADATSVRLEPGGVAGLPSSDILLELGDTSHTALENVVAPLDPALTTLELDGTWDALRIDLLAEVVDQGEPNGQVTFASGSPPGSGPDD